MLKKFILIIILCLIPSLVCAAEVTLKWNPSADIKEYRLYETFTSGEYVYGKDSESYVVTITAGTETITIFVEDNDVDFLFWVLTAVDFDDLESGPSNEACIEEPDPPNNGGSGGCFMLIISKVRRSR